MGLAILAVGSPIVREQRAPARLPIHDDIHPTTRGRAIGTRPLGRAADHSSTGLRHTWPSDSRLASTTPAV